VLAAIYLIRNALRKKGCGGSCGCSKPVEKARNADYWVGELQLKTREKKLKQHPHCPKNKFLLSSALEVRQDAGRWLK